MTPTCKTLKKNEKSKKGLWIRQMIHKSKSSKIRLSYLTKMKLKMAQSTNLSSENRRIEGAILNFTRTYKTTTEIPTKVDSEVSQKYKPSLNSLRKNLRMMMRLSHKNQW